MDTFLSEVGKATDAMATALGLGSSIPLLIFSSFAVSLLSVGAVFVINTNARANRRNAQLLGDIEAVSARLNEGERLGKFGTFTWNYQHPEMSFWSDQMYELCGLLRRRHVPQVPTLLDAVVDEDKEVAKAQWEAAQTKPGPFSFVYRTRGLGAELHFVRAEGVTVFDATMHPYSTAGVLRDVTREVEIDRAKSEFVSLASHQLKTPLTAIRWHCEGLLANAAGPLSDAQTKYVRVINEANHRMIALVNELLNVSRIELDTFSQKPEELDLRALVESVIEEQRATSAERQQQLNVSIGDVPHIIADKTMARMVFQNLISNAIKYTPVGGSVTCEVGLGGAKKEGIFLKVSDTGIGIPKKEQGRVFEKLHRASNARVLVSDGTGLGLYVVKMILEHAGGAISFESIEGKGTTFYVTFPFDWQNPDKVAGGRGR